MSRNLLWDFFSIAQFHQINYAYTAKLLWATRTRIPPSFSFCIFFLSFSIPTILTSVADPHHFDPDPGSDKIRYPYGSGFESRPNIDTDSNLDLTLIQVRIQAFTKHCRKKVTKLLNSYKKLWLEKKHLVLMSKEVHLIVLLFCNL